MASLNWAKLVTLLVLACGFVVFSWGMVSIVETYKHRYADIVMTSGWVCVVTGLVISSCALVLLTRASMEIVWRK